MTAGDPDVNLNLRFRELKESFRARRANCVTTSSYLCGSHDDGVYKGVRVGLHIHDVSFLTAAKKYTCN